MYSFQLEAFLSWAFVPVDDGHFEDSDGELPPSGSAADSSSISTTENGKQEPSLTGKGNQGDDFSDQATNDGGHALLRLIRACSSSSAADPPANDPLLWTRPDDDADAGPATLFLAAPPGHLLTGPVVVMSNARRVEYSIVDEDHVPTTVTSVAELPFEYQTTLTAIWCAPAEEDGSWWQRVAVPVESPVRAVRLKFVSLPRDEKDIFILRYLRTPEPTAAVPPPATRPTTGNASAAVALLSSMMGGVGGGGPAMPGPASMMAMLAARMQGAALGGGVSTAPMGSPIAPAAVAPPALVAPPAVAASPPVPAGETAPVDPQPRAAVEPAPVDQLEPVLAAIARMEANLTAKLDRVVSEVSGLNRRLEVVERAVLARQERMRC